MRQSNAILLVTITLGAAAIANYLLYTNPPATAPLAPPVAIGPAGSASVVSEGKRPASELLLVQSQIRPLFTPTRRKWVEPVQPAPVLPDAALPLAQAEPPPILEPVVAETPPPQVTLIGIEKTPLSAKALLLKTGTAEALWVKNGETLEGWAVKVIDAGSVEVALGDRRIRLELYPPLPVPEIEP
jgi:hypothetical protein